MASFSASPSPTYPQYFMYTMMLSPDFETKKTQMFFQIAVLPILGICRFENGVIFLSLNKETFICIGKIQLFYLRECFHRGFTETHIKG